MAETQLVDRRTLVQINATIIAGMLIFLTISDFSSETPYSILILVFTLLGFALLLTSLGLCFITGKQGSPYSDSLLFKRFGQAETSFVVGVIFLFVTVAFLLIVKLF